MTNTIDMQVIRYINLFERIAKVSTTDCFVYNNMIIFAVPKPLVAKAVGKNGENPKKISEILRKKIKIVAKADNLSEMPNFIFSIVEPITFTKIEVKDNIVKLTAGKQSKAALIGRNRVREQEL